MRITLLRVLSDSESVKHFFFFCPGYTAQSSVLIAASTLGEMWSLSSNARYINFFIVLGSLNLMCKIFWPMSEACEIAQPVDLKLGKVSYSFIKFFVIV